MTRTRLWAAVPTALLLTAGALVPASAHVPDQPPVVAQSAAASPETTRPDRTVRLITGDRVTVGNGLDGKQTASVKPGPGRTGILFRTVEENGNLSVLPSDAMSAISSGELDRRLFNVTGLLKQGYDEAHSQALPLIVSQPQGERGTVDRLAALSDKSHQSHRLDSINARSLRVELAGLGRFWEELSSSTFKAMSGGTSVWLNGRVEATLDRSAAQINAPAAWEAGYRGEGVRVAVLDTGADLAHPDLAGRAIVSKDFSGSTGTGDAFGHGTHVAATVGGSGAASGGSRKGVAPQADLLIGKVLGDDGFGSEAAVIDGMEWAVDQGARVVNMSLGSDAPTDGTDPMSLALNTLSVDSGSLFVVAAGNNGSQGEQTIGSPGAAEAALTVGAVDRNDSLAAFSSRGPRLGDRAVKPDVTAPGVSIVAARAEGTTMGQPVDSHYVAASGTSMASPHVAGAAALLAQQHPTWDAARLKDVLISTAHIVSSQKVTEQGGGRIDLAAASLSPVTATGTVALGSFSSDDTAKSADHSMIRYTNTSSSEVSLGLTMRLETAGGRQIAEGGVAPSADTVRVAAGSTAEVSLKTDLSVITQGDYYGYVTATPTGGGTAVHTTVSISVHGPTHRLTVLTVDHRGEHIQAQPMIWGPDGFVNYVSGQPAVAEVEEGTYQLSHSSVVRAADGEELREVVLPEVKVTKDMTVTLDARKTTQVEIRTPRPAEQRGVLSYQTYRQLDGRVLIQGTVFFDIAKRIYVSPTVEVTEGQFEFASRWQLVAPMLQARVLGSDVSLQPYYMPASMVFGDKGARLVARDAGAGTESDFQRSGLRGTLAIVKSNGSGDVELAERAAKAGVAGLLLVSEPGLYGWTRWSPVGDRLALPTMRVTAAEGEELLQRVARARTTVEFSGTARSPYLYDVVQVSEGRVPQRVVHTVSERNSAVVETGYAESGGTSWASEQRFARRPYQSFVWNQYSRYVPTGKRRTEYISAGDTLWQHIVNYRTITNIDVPLTTGMRNNSRSYQAGRQPAETWFGAVLRPSIPRGTTTPSVRLGNVLALRIPEFTDSGAGHWSQAEVGGGGVGTSLRDAEPEGDAVSVSLFRDGRHVAGAEGAWADFEVASGRASYRLEVSTSRSSAEWELGTRTKTSWSFVSDSAAEETALPLLQLDYGVPVGLLNSVGRRDAHTIALSVRSQDGLPVPRGVTVRVATSLDDGDTWSKEVRAGDRGGNRFAASLPGLDRHRASGFVTLRVTATDDAGNSVQQTVKRAYRYDTRG